MTLAARWDVAALYDSGFMLVCRVRVPVDRGLPEIILWGNRYFVKSIPYGCFREGHCYMIPLEDMHAGEQGGKKHAAPKGKP